MRRKLYDSTCADKSEDHGERGNEIFAGLSKHCHSRSDQQKRQHTRHASSRQMKKVRVRNRCPVNSKWYFLKNLTD